ncbi:RusA family crossover junction endodeoxyribonuclease [Planococcus versutus]|uniref:Holliday junction resolvase n=1 Tax=Planococcus versutus TaxID=1302659 RepID=A0A1B1S5H3_9BACL|nr:RusA family crossover junction endodeoxyribonuclease [Planococcus versutus]ANU28437.1 hypothetical protein I858_015715 [Planococcus versutus]
METISFVIHGEAQAQGRPRAGKSFSGKTVLYDPINSRDFKQYVSLVASQHRPKELITSPIHLELIFHQPTPKKYHTKPKQALIESGELLPITKPDLDNLVKGVKDGITKIIWQDDSQVVSMHVQKLYSLLPRVEVTIRY